jgi:hypothetical protein
MPSDPNQIGRKVVDLVVENTTETLPEAEPKKRPRKKNPAAVALGRLGGKKGGRARANKLTAERKSEIAKAAAKARWKRHRETG